MGYVKFNNFQKKRLLFSSAVCHPSVIPTSHCVNILVMITLAYFRYLFKNDSNEEVELLYV